MEEFSQSRGDDDLFDDEIVPCEPPQQDALATQLQTSLCSLPPLYRSLTKAMALPEAQEGEDEVVL